MASRWTASSESSLPLDQQQQRQSVVVANNDAADDTATTDYSSFFTSFISILIPPQPDPLPVERVLKAIVIDVDTAIGCNNTADSVLPVECITCQVRLYIPTEATTTTTAAATRSTTAKCVTALSSAWTLQSLNVYGQPTMSATRTRICSFPNERKWQECHDEFYMVYHTHEHAIKGNRPLAIAILKQQLQQQQQQQQQQRGPITTTPMPLNGSENESNLLVPLPPYTVEWVTSPMNFDAATFMALIQKAGHVSIHFCYTAGIGALPPPIKQHWHNGGSTQTCYIHHNVKSPFENGRNVGIRHFGPPSLGVQLSQCYDSIVAVGDSILEQLVASESAVSNGSIYFGTKIAMPLLTHTVPLFVQAVGEALQAAVFVGMRNRRDPNYNNGTENHCSGTHYETHATHTRPARVALILNSALWDVLSDEATIMVAPSTGSTEDMDRIGQNGHNTNCAQDDPWSNHIQALSEYLVAVRELCHCNYVPQEVHVTIYWLLPTAVHIHRVHLADCESTQQRAPHKIRRTMYMSASRTRQLYERQRLVVASILSSSMQECVPPILPERSEQSIQRLDDGNEIVHDNADDATFDESIGIGAAGTGSNSTSFMLDLYEATYLSADWTLPGDGRHYRPELNARMLSWFL